MSKKINIIYVSFVLSFVIFFTIHTPCHFILFTLWCKTRASSLRRPCCCSLCIRSQFALVAPSFGIGFAKRKKKPRSKATDRPSVWIFWYFIVFVLVSSKSFLWRETRRDSQKSPINILVQKSLLVRRLCPKVLLCWKKKWIFGLVESGFSSVGWMWLQCLSSPEVSQSVKLKL